MPPLCTARSLCRIPSDLLSGGISGDAASLPSDILKQLRTPTPRCCIAGLTILRAATTFTPSSSPSSPRTCCTVCTPTEGLHIHSIEVVLALVCGNERKELQGGAAGTRGYWALCGAAGSPAQFAAEQC